MAEEVQKRTNEGLPEGFVIRTGKHVYRVKRRLSAGGFGITYLAENLQEFTLAKTTVTVPKGELLVLKECFNAATMQRLENGQVILTNADRGVRLREQFYNEARQLRKRMYMMPSAVRGRVESGFVPIYHTAHMSEDLTGANIIFFVMPYITGGSLKDYVRAGASPSPEQDGLMWMLWLKKLLHVMSELHGSMMPMIHCDIKPANIMLSGNREPVLIDFGAVTDGDGAVMFTRQYAPMEQWGSAALLKAAQGSAATAYRTRVQRSPERCRATPRTDIYCLAATFYHLMVGTTPPEAWTRPPVSAQDPYKPLAKRESLLIGIAKAALKNNEFVVANKLQAMGKTKAIAYTRDFVKRFLTGIDHALSPLEKSRFSGMAEWGRYVYSGVNMGFSIKPRTSADPSGMITGDVSEVSRSRSETNQKMGASRSATGAEVAAPTSSKSGMSESEPHQSEWEQIVIYVSIGLLALLLVVVVLCYCL